MIEVGIVQVPNRADEMTIHQFEKVSHCLSDGSVLPVFRYTNALIALGVDKEVLDEKSPTELGKICRTFNEWRKVDKDREEARTFELNGKTYEAYKEGEEFKVTMKDVEMIEKFLSKNKYQSTKVFCEIIATLFKDTSLSQREHYAEAHVKHKAKLIRESNMIVEPFINYIVMIVHELYLAAQEAKIIEDGVPK